ncbi:DUF3129 domain-containing protein [Aspergillus alliaceus]|uniref:DUF3129 domain-containing protein n=1 Tax=Petromyces alliaceus TaxID=209559 RepID=UPI0012A75FB4|nr:uncharacterized protein BDW43DRAFT_323321 [Aspergillus alliaceus]KAB8228036.1 hypothetical protein BDW43DRAFT_323321 [Aspergillus alliaceus]
MYIANVLTVTGFLLSQAVAHGLITRIKGDNGVVMPGLTVMDGMPRGCPSAACGAQGDTAIIRDQEMDGNKASPLGRTNTGGPVNPATVINSFMGAGNSNSKRAAFTDQRRQMINDAASIITNAGGAILNGAQDLADATPFGGAIKNAQSAVDDVAGLVPGMGSGAMTSSDSKENGNQQYAGHGSSKGLPTPNENSIITMTYHQVNQDGAGPLFADIDATSGGTDPRAFKSAEVIKNVPGVAGFSTSSTMDYDVQVKVPSGMKCRGTVGATRNVCIVRVRNNAISGPFGGSAAFTN